MTGDRGGECVLLDEERRGWRASARVFVSPLGVRRASISAFQSAR
jgi:hypothetical protein